MLAFRPLCLIGLALVATGAGAVRAQDSIAQDSVRAPKPFVFGMTANAMAIDGATAGAQLVGARSWGMQFDGGILLKRLYVGIDFGPQFLSDRASFTQNTTGGELKSTAMLVYFSAMAGPRTRPFRLVSGMAPMALGLYGGVSATASERSIDNCVDCYQETIDIPGGTFVQPVMMFGTGRARLRLSDRVFMGSKGIQSVMSAGMELGTP